MRAVAARFALGVPVRRRDSRDAASAAVPSARRRRAASSAAAPDAPESSSSLAPTSAPTLARRDLDLLLRAVELAAGSDGLTQPHPKSACVLTTPAGDVAAEAFQLGQGGTRAEILAERDAAGAARGGVAYLNLEPVHGPSAGEDAAVAALVDAGVARCVVGIEHPVAGVRGQAVAA
jgi:diaminohydroxyphosphoribosylaminopyrimidine deaminase/5-amino-6-(5-phosphoribosylamino)uracil reductase